MTTDKDFSGLSKSQTLAWKPAMQLSSKFVTQAIFSKKILYCYVLNTKINKVDRQFVHVKVGLQRAEMHLGSACSPPGN